MGSAYITSVEYIRQDAFYDFHVVGNNNYELAGILHHNSGKSVCTASHFAALATDRPLYGQDGQEIPLRRPKPGKVWLMWVIGWDQAHIGQTIHRLLFEPGLFKIVRDRKTGQWRTYNDALPADAVRSKEAVSAEPLIPERYLDGEHAWSWEDKAGKVFKSVRLRFKNRAGKEQIVLICAYPSTQPQAKQGDPVDVIWIDEDIRFAQHYKEWQDRLSDRAGQLMWSAWPHSSNDALVKVQERAEAQKDLPDPYAFEVVLRFSDNPYIGHRQKQEAWDRMGSDEERRARDYGEFLFDTVRIYDFKAGVHGVPNYNHEDVFEKIWNQHGEFPRDWTRYMAIDPSHTRTGIVFGVVPPQIPEYGKVLIIENELLLKRAGCDECAKRVQELLCGKPFEWFIMDQMAGRQTAIGQTKTNRRQYAEAFEKLGIKSRSSGSSFLDGSNDIGGRQNMLRSLMYDDGLSKGTQLRIVLEKCPHLIYELKNTRKRVVGGEVEDKVAGKQHDLLDALEYLVAAEPAWVDPEAYATFGGGPVYQYVKDFKEKSERREQGGDFVHFGPGNPSAAA